MNKPNQQDAIATIERCAALILDDALPFEYNHEALSRLFKAAFGESHESFEADAVIPVNPDAGGGEAVYAVSLIRGVILHLDGKMRLDVRQRHPLQSPRAREVDERSRNRARPDAGCRRAA